MNNNQTTYILDTTKDITHKLKLCIIISFVVFIAIMCSVLIHHRNTQISFSKPDVKTEVSYKTWTSDTSWTKGW